MGGWGGDSAALTTLLELPSELCCCLGPPPSLFRMDKRRVCLAVDASDTSKSAVEWVGRSLLGQKMNSTSDEASKHGCAGHGRSCCCRRLPALRPSRHRCLWRTCHPMHGSSARLTSHRLRSKTAVLVEVT